MYQSSIWENGLILCGKSQEHLQGAKPKCFTGEFHGISMDFMNKDVGYLSGDIPSGDEIP